MIIRSGVASILREGHGHSGVTRFSGVWDMLTCFRPSPPYYLGSGDCIPRKIFELLMYASEFYNIFCTQIDTTQVSIFIWKPEFHRVL